MNLCGNHEATQWECILIDIGKYYLYLKKKKDCPCLTYNPHDHVAQDHQHEQHTADYIRAAPGRNRPLETLKESMIRDKISLNAYIGHL